MLAGSPLFLTDLDAAWSHWTTSQCLLWNIVALLGTALLNCTYFKFVHWQVKAPMYWTEIQFVLLAALAPGHACYQSLFPMFCRCLSHSKHQVNVMVHVRCVLYSANHIMHFRRQKTGFRFRFFLISPPFSVQPPSAFFCFQLSNSFPFCCFLQVRSNQWPVRTNV